MVGPSCIPQYGARTKQLGLGSLRGRAGTGQARAGRASPRTRVRSRGRLPAGWGSFTIFGRFSCFSFSHSGICGLGSVGVSGGLENGFGLQALGFRFKGWMGGFWVID